MKKQILFLAFFTLALIFAGTNNVFAQVGGAKAYVVVPTALPACITPETLAGCVADELHPVQGQTYDYVVNTTAATDIVRWFVVDNTAMEAAGDSLVSSVTGILAAANGAIDLGDGTDPYLFDVISGTYNSAGAAATGSTSTIQLQWKYFDGVTNQVILVAYVEGADGCTNNIAVYRIIPTPAFTIDVASVDEDGVNPAGPLDAANSECVSPIESAVYAGAGTTPAGTLTVDYGENWAFFVVNGANYIDSWKPEFQLSYNGGTAPVAEMSWAYRTDANDADPANWHTLTGTGVLAAAPTTWTSSAIVIAGADAATEGTAGYSIGEGNVPASGGECIVVRVRLNWGTDIEHDGANGTLTFAANGIAYDGVGTVQADFYDDRTSFEDLNNTPGAVAPDACAPDSFDNDVVDYIITPRPQVEEGTPLQETKSGEGAN